MEVRRTGTGFVGAAAAANTRMPAGHPEGFIEGFANLYRNFADTLGRRLDGDKNAAGDFATVREGIRSIAFVEAVVQSSNLDLKWVKVGRSGS